MFDYRSFSLPVAEVVPELREKLSTHNTLILSAPPGAGKSTLLPLCLLEEPWMQGKKMLMLEPRRLAAKTIAMRMSDMIGESVGKTVGYRVRFENRISAGTRIEVITEGILTRILQDDNALEGVGMVLFDEFHERSIHADLALALCRDAQQVLRPDLRILVMSATLDMPRLSTMLNAPVVKSEGRLFPVKVHYAGGQDKMLISDLAARVVMQAGRENEGDILCFLPGEGEIRKCEEILKTQLKGFRIHPLYGMLPPAAQMAAIMPDRNGQRKVVLTTSIAETSLTIEGVSIVVDSGLIKSNRFDPNSGLSRLETHTISRDSADQRAGRAGRLGPGVCYRMWTAADHERMAEHRIPEIMDADLSSLMLELAQWGIADVYQLNWLNAPPKGHVAQALDVLHDIEALDSGRITEHGRKIAALPCHPRLAHMLLWASENKLLALACDLAAVLEERDPLPRDSGIDINLRVEALRRFRAGNGKEGRMGRIEKVAALYRQMFKAEPDNDVYDHHDAGVLIAHAFPERIASARPGNNAQFQLANGRYAQAGHRDDLSDEPWLAVAHLDAREGLGKIFMAAPLNPRDLAPMVKEQEKVTWDTRKGGLIANKEWRIGSLVLMSKPLPAPDPSHLAEAISEAIRKEGEQLLNFNEETTQWQNRVGSLRQWRPDEAWPEVSTSALLQRNKEWLGGYLQGVKKAEDLKKINLAEALQQSLTWEQQQELDRLAPKMLKVPSGSMVPIEYFSRGEPPVLAVRLQQVFGLAETPRINEGRTPLLMHLLSPSNKPVQVTSDLKSFWNGTYFEVKKELKRRYPKHSWPDDPWTAEPIRGVKKKGS